MSEVVNAVELFGKNVFNETVTKERLPKSVFKKLKKTIEDDAELDPSIVDVVTHATKDWAIEKGVTYYTHWFQPLTGVTAEKHDSFISAPDAEGKIVMEFSGKELTKGEPDTSSFPSGGLRVTFEARGYTAWDCMSPALLREDAIGVTLCTPTASCSYKGEVLDQKTPLLRSTQTTDKEALRILRLFGSTRAKRVVPSVGLEQEYFLVDRAKYLWRKDLTYAGRTLFGATPPKGQELEDHHFGAIRERTGSYINKINQELWKLGVSAKTQHNEAAPAQHELAPIYDQASLAVDHNQMATETMKKVAGRRGLTYLPHEKPFAGVDDSGKHNNWSIAPDDGTDMLNPGDTPHENIQFLLVLDCILKAADIHADLFRESAADVGSDYRLGANEASSAIISIFVGEQLEDVIDQLCSTGKATCSKKGDKLMTGATTFPNLDKDAMDRNRISSFAFTGNKFEFHMAGSSDSVAAPNVVLNTITTEAFKEVADELEKAVDFDTAVHDMIKKLLADHRRITFNGNGYSDVWVEEAERGGLSNIKFMVDVISALKTEKAVKLFETFRMLIRAKLESRVEIEFEVYSKVINIEVRTMTDMASKQTIPAVIKCTTELVRSINAVAPACPSADTSAQAELLVETSALLSDMKVALVALAGLTEKCGVVEGAEEQARAYRDEIVPAMMVLREPADKLKMIVDKELWPMPSYGNLIFEVQDRSDIDERTFLEEWWTLCLGGGSFYSYFYWLLVVTQQDQYW